MSQHPVNLAIRFLLEIGALVSMGYWGSTLGTGLVAIGGAAGMPLLAMVIWGVFRVPNDPGNAPVPVPGIVRLGIELLFFGSAIGMQSAAFSPIVAGVFAAAVIVHYGVSYDRVRRLLGLADQP